MSLDIDGEGIDEVVVGDDGDGEDVAEEIGGDTMGSIVAGVLLIGMAK